MSQRLVAGREQELQPLLAFEGEERECLSQQVNNSGIHRGAGNPLQGRKDQQRSVRRAGSAGASTALIPLPSLGQVLCSLLRDLS